MKSLLRRLFIVVALLCVLIGIAMTAIIRDPACGNDWFCLLSGLGPNFIVAGIVPLVFLLYSEAESRRSDSRNDDVDRRLGAIEAQGKDIERLASATLADMRAGSALADSGVIEVIAQRGQHMRDYVVRHENAVRAVDLLGIDLRSVSSNFSQFADSLSPATAYRILLLNPEYPTRSGSVAKLRADVEKLGNYSALEDIKQYCRAFARWKAGRSDWSGSYEIRLYNGLPTVHYARFDDEAYVGPYLAGRTGSTTYAFLCRRGGYVFEQARENFDLLWSELSTSVPEAWFE